MSDEMTKIRILELFGGIGACSAALKRIGFDVELLDYVEIDENAVASFNAMHGTNYESQDITKWDKDIEGVDLLMHGSPCQSFSLAGKHEGGDEGSGTKSSLMYETIRIVEKIRPKYVVWENVKNLLSEKHKHNFDNYIERMNQLGYRSFYKVLNSKDFGVPQKRERVYTISIREDINKEFSFPSPIELKIRMKDVLEKEVDEKYYLTQDHAYRIANWKAFQNPLERVDGTNSICPTLTARGAGENHSGMITYSHLFDSDVNVREVFRKRGKDQLCRNELQIRVITPRECFRFQGFSTRNQDGTYNDEYFDRASKVNNDRELYRQAGNSITVDVLCHIFKNLFF